MKYEWQKLFGKSFDGETAHIQWLNTPSRVIVIEEGVPAIHDGLNLTPEGDWILAPGFNPRHVTMMMAQNEIDQLKKERDALAAKIEKAIQYGNDTLACNQTLKGQQFAADHFLKILRGEA